MRTINEHIANPVNDSLEIKVRDEPGAGGANHHYRISWGEAGPESSRPQLNVHFQNGPINEAGVNGVTQEALLAIVIDRLRSFQAGPFSCRDNAIALTHCEEALLWLKKRTFDRMARGVEGRNVV